MQFEYIGKILEIKNLDEFAVSHAMIPTPLQIEANVCRVYFSSQSREGIARPRYVDINMKTLEIVSEVSKVLLELGEPGSFDDNGILTCSAVKVGNDLIYMYYAGFELGIKVRYKLFTGLAISDDGGNTFRKFSQAPILDRTSSELNFRAGPFVQHVENKFSMYYVGGSEWLNNHGAVKPVYGIQLAESEDGINWENEKSVLVPNMLFEHGFGRPYIFKYLNSEYLSYSIRDIKTNDYKLGLSIFNSENLIRIDDSIVINMDGRKLANKSLMYASFLPFDGKLYMFYNTAHFGLDGIHLAVLN